MAMVTEQTISDTCAVVRTPRSVVPMQIFHKQSLENENHGNQGRKTKAADGSGRAPPLSSLPL